MSPRSYRLGKRADSIQQTRTRILAATRALLARDGYPQLPIDEVARRADVARATVYYQFGSKRGLLEAVVADVQRRTGQQQVVAAVEPTDPIQALRRAFQQASFMGVDNGLGTVAEAQLAVDVCHTIWAGVGARDARR